MDKYMYWMDCVLQLGTASKCRLLEMFREPEQIYKAPRKQLLHIVEEKKVMLLEEAKKCWDLNQKFEELQQMGIHMVTMGEKNYPEKLRHIPDPPFALYCRGSLPREDIPAVAVIGARECSEYGTYIARELGRSLGKYGIQLISGMAKGVDGISQAAALEAGGSSFGILGCGVDVCYPKSNRSLYEQLINRGGVLSSYPPGTSPQAKLFPPRNRIVSGLADVLVVVEARMRSGTSITVDMALEQGRDVYAVPGRITDRLSDGCNKMLREGAYVFLSPDDFLEELKHLIPEKMNQVEKAGEEDQLRREVEEKSKRIKLQVISEGTESTGKIKEKQGKEDGSLNWKDRLISVLDYYPRHAEDIAERMYQRYSQEISAAELNVMLMQLYLEGQIQQEAPGWYGKIEKKPLEK